MKRLLTTLWVASFLATPVLAERTVETDTYLTGAWGSNRSQKTLELYQKVGFTMNGGPETKLISGVSGIPPQHAARPFEDADGRLLNSVGLFTHVNFNAPSVEAWWRESVAKQVAAKGKNIERIAFWKVHNEFGYHGSGVFDYSAGAIGKYRDWLQRKYGTIEQLNHDWQTNWTSFATVEPPRQDFARQLPNWLDWRRFTAWNFGRYFRETGDMIRQFSPQAKVSDNFYMTSGLDGWDLFELARQTDYVAMDIYAIERWDSLIGGMDMARSAAYAWKKPFLMMEYHAGPNHWITHVYAWHLYTEALLALARESRALQWYMWSPGKNGREEGIHGILSLDDQPTERMTAVTKINEFVRRLAPVLNRAQLKPVVGVLRSNDSQYLQRALGQNIWQYIEDDKRLGRLLDIAGIPYVFVDTEQLTEAALENFQALIVSGSPIVSAAAMKTLEAFISSGKTVVFHPEAATRDAFGAPRADWQHFTPAGKPSAAAPMATHVLTGKPAVPGLPEGQFAVENLRGGKRAFCAWQMSRLPIKDKDAFDQIARQYAEFLRQVAQVEPEVELSGTGLARADIDVKLLRSQDLRMLYVTKLSPGDAQVTVSVPDEGLGTSAWFMAPDRAQLVRHEGVRQQGRLVFTLPLEQQTGVSGGVLLYGHWQPMISLSLANGQDTLRVGEETELCVRVINLGRETVSGNIAVQLPAGWQSTPLSGNDISELRPGESAEKRFSFRVPPTVQDDFFAYENPLTAEVEFTSGVKGKLSAKLLPFVKRELDVRVMYRGEMLNPWQELTPPVLRWGWDNEVRTPPPTPLSVRGDVQATLLIDAKQDLYGKPLSLLVHHEDGTRGKIRFADKEAPVIAREVPVILDLPKAGRYSLICLGNGTPQVEMIPAAAGEETARRQMQQSKAPLAPGERLLAVASRRASAGTEVRMELRQACAGEMALFRLVDGERRPVCAVFGEKEVTFNADVAADDVSLYVLQPGKSAPVAPRVEAKTFADGRLQVTGDSYRVLIDTKFGWVERLDIREKQSWRPFLVERTGPVVKRTDGQEVGPESSSGVSMLCSSFSQTSGVLEFERPLDDGRISVYERWHFEPNHISIDLRVRNRGRAPVKYRSLDYDIGVNAQSSEAWRVMSPEGETLREAFLPRQTQASGREILELQTAWGAVMAVSRRRCAQNLKWASIANAVSHSMRRTKVSLVRAVSIDPGDFVLAEFDWWFSGKGAAAVGDPGLTTVE